MHLLANATLKGFQYCQTQIFILWLGTPIDSIWNCSSVSRAKLSRRGDLKLLVPEVVSDTVTPTGTPQKDLMTRTLNHSTYSLHE